MIVGEIPPVPQMPESLKAVIQVKVDYKPAPTKVEPMEQDSIPPPAEQLQQQQQSQESQQLPEQVFQQGQGSETAKKKNPQESEEDDRNKQ